MRVSTYHQWLKSLRMRCAKSAMREQHAGMRFLRKNLHALGCMLTIINCIAGSISYHKEYFLSFVFENTQTALT